MFGWPIIFVFGLSARIKQEHGLKDWDAETECDAARSCMYEHQGHVDQQDERHSSFCKREVRAAVKNVGRNAADHDFDREKREFAVFEQAGHEGVTFGSDIQAQPNECKLGIEPVEREQE